MLGKYFVRKIGRQIKIGKIVETEAYIGPHDKASHAYAKKLQKLSEKIKVLKNNFWQIEDYVSNKAKFLKLILESQGKITKRNLAEYLRGGHLYIYLVYGNYYQCNITSYKEGVPECVLIRAVEPILNIEGKTNGPGLFCEEFKLNSEFYGEDLCQSKRVWLTEGLKIKSTEIVTSKRIGIDYAEEHKHLLWRFYLKNNKYVSKF